MKNQPNVMYAQASLKDVKVELVHSTNASQKAPDIYLAVDNGVSTFRAKTSSRFWKSFNMKYETSQSIFRYFTPSEVLERVAETPMGQERIRFAVEQKSTGAQLLGMSSLDKPLITVEDVSSIIEKNLGQNARYHNGVISVDFRPKSGERAFKIGGDDFENRYVLDVPVDQTASQPRGVLRP